MFDYFETFKMVLMILSGVGIFITFWMTMMYYMIEE